MCFIYIKNIYLLWQGILLIRLIFRQALLISQDFLQVSELLETYFLMHNVSIFWQKEMKKDKLSLLLLMQVWLKLHLVMQQKKKLRLLLLIRKEVKEHKFITQHGLSIIKQEDLTMMNTTQLLTSSSLTWKLFKYHSYIEIQSISMEWQKEASIYALKSMETFSLL